MGGGGGRGDIASDPRSRIRRAEKITTNMVKQMSWYGRREDMPSNIGRSHCGVALNTRERESRDIRVTETGVKERHEEKQTRS
jgi:hypothetical protein